MAGGVNSKPMPQFKAALVAAISAVALVEAPPLWLGTYDIIEIAAYGGLIASAPSLVAKALRMIADQLDHLAAMQPRGMKGTAGWATSIKELSHHLVQPSLFRTGHAPYWGCLKRGFLGFGRRSLHANITAVAAVFGASGSGKDTGVLLVNCLAIPGSKVILDFDGSTSCIMADALRRRGEAVHILNFDDTFADILGESDRYNPLEILADNLERPGGVLDVSSECTQFAKALYAEPPNEGGDGNKYFRNGSRSLIKFAQQICVLIGWREASMSDVLAIIQDREMLLQHALWAAGRLEQAEVAFPAAYNG